MLLKQPLMTAKYLSHLTDLSLTVCWLAN